MFPIGAFSHSDGLEAATSSGEVSTGDDFRRWLMAVRDHALRTFEGPAVSRAWRAASLANVTNLVAVDGEVHALRPAAAAREASRAMGSRLLKTWQQLHPATSFSDLSPLPDTLTLPVAFGLVCQRADVTEADAVGAYAYTRLAASLSSAMRLMSLGQRAGHTILSDALSGLPMIVDDVVRSSAPLGSFTPLMDIAAMRHQYVHSRLFRS
ncbi:MAG: urease accessory UreF family protein [Vicinamibacterales bacterium]